MFRKGKMIKREALTISEVNMEALDSDKNEIHKFLECEQADKINEK